MKTEVAFFMGQASRGKEQMVFDWEKAARRIVEKKPKTVWAGLQGDWEWTGGEIWRDGAPCPVDDTYTYLASTWAIPELELDGEREPCYRMESEVPEWNEKTYWPTEARKIIYGEK